FARNGFRVHLYDMEPAILDRALVIIQKNLDRELAKNKITAEQKSETLGRIAPTTDRSTLSGCDFLVEAASEKLEIKLALFAETHRLSRPGVILASHTSSISITKLAARTAHAERVIGMHFFNPVPVMKLVEIVRGLATSDETFQTVRDLAVRLDKTPV